MIRCFVKAEPVFRKCKAVHTLPDNLIEYEHEAHIGIVECKLKIPTIYSNLSAFVPILQGPSLLRLSLPLQ